LAISACLTPTDPIICAAIVGKSYISKLSFTPNPSKGGEFARRHVPENLRLLLAAESASNDGLAYPFLTLALYLTLDSSRGVAITHWVLIGCLCMSTFASCERLF
jgi:NhaP-type Na+/H+ or K+/H+ antiporter